MVSSLVLPAPRSSDLLMRDRSPEIMSLRGGAINTTSPRSSGLVPVSSVGNNSNNGSGSVSGSGTSSGLARTVPDSDLNQRDYDSIPNDNEVVNGADSSTGAGAATIGYDTNVNSVSAASTPSSTSVFTSQSSSSTTASTPIPFFPSTGQSDQSSKSTGHESTHNEYFSSATDAPLPGSNSTLHTDSLPTNLQPEESSSPVVSIELPKTSSSSDGSIDEETLSVSSITDTPSTSLGVAQKDSKSYSHVASPLTPTSLAHLSPPTVSLLYPDTAPRETWRPQLDAWMKKNHPLKLKELSQISYPWIHDKLPSTAPINFPSRPHSHTSTSSSSSSHRDTTSTSTSSSSSHSVPPSSRSQETSPPYPPATLSTTSIYGKAGLSKVSSSNSILPLYASSASHDRTSTASSMSPTTQYLSPSLSIPSSSASSTSSGSLSMSVPTVSSSSYHRPQKAARRASYSATSHTKPYSRPNHSTIGGPTGLSQEDDDRDDHAHIHNPRLPSPPESPQLSANSNSQLTLEQYTNSIKRRCISCGSDQSPCWRPSWSASAGQLCNSCGLRYKKTGARCLSAKCGRIPAKGEWAAMKSVAVRVGGQLHYSCLWCGDEVEVMPRG
ncbi:DNA-binding transcription repressor ASH1 [Sugiyamaella lignohabitans]|uniref:DNA-binding transcription repressor ASH1 n=1 Tax=Sugiyamaella lignohabitans TaxID=796027 RepID=A0A161HKY2_9ASCO|nr:DNA-binding transcription repressor ASH1 [Sugiyamaella lignohabitans]ANB13827.1 DNA-binding transcription repressor ASH1 [Sugiyamaella lignohabitans]